MPMHAETLAILASPLASGLASWVAVKVGLARLEERVKAQNQRIAEQLRRIEWLERGAVRPHS